MPKINNFEYDGQDEKTGLYYKKNENGTILSWYSVVTNKTYQNEILAIGEQNDRLDELQFPQDYAGVRKYNVESTGGKVPAPPVQPVQPVNSENVQQVVQDKARENYVRQELEDAVKREQDIVINKDGKNYTAKYDKDSGLYLYKDENGFIKTTTPEDVVIDASPDDPIRQNVEGHYNSGDYTDPSFTGQQAKERNKLKELDKQINENNTQGSQDQNTKLEDQKKAINKSLNGQGLDEKERAAYKEAMEEIRKFLDWRK